MLKVPTQTLPHEHYYSNQPTQRHQPNHATYGLATSSPRVSKRKLISRCRTTKPLTGPYHKPLFPTTNATSSMSPLPLPPPAPSTPSLIMEDDEIFAEFDLFTQSPQFLSSPPPSPSPDDDHDFDFGDFPLF